MTTPLDRRQFVQSVAATATGLTLGTSIFAADKNINMKIYTYKTVGKLQIKADVYRPADDKTRPVALWIHGGALIMGNRAGISRRVREALLDDGYAVVSIDYRLAPETKIDGIISDIDKPTHSSKVNPGLRLYWILIDDNVKCFTGNQLVPQ